MALEVVAQVAVGLTAIQKQHLVHRDIKPSNIMVSLEEGRLESVKIIDLGLAKVVAEEDPISAVGGFTGTPGYASPEQFAGLGTDIRSDLYSLGITLWEMLSRKASFPRFCRRVDVPASTCCAAHRKAAERSGPDYRAAGSSAGERS